MKCPNCDETLVMADRKLQLTIVPPAVAYANPLPARDRRCDSDGGYRKQYPQQGGHYNDLYNKQKKKKGFLGGFLDFD